MSQPHLFSPRRGDSWGLQQQLLEVQVLQAQSSYFGFFPLTS